MCEKSKKDTVCIPRIPVTLYKKNMSTLGLSLAVPTIVNTLKNDTTITALVDSASIFPVIKTTDSLPVVSVTRQGWTAIRSKGGINSIFGIEDIVSEEVTIAIVVFSRDYDKSNELAEAIAVSLDGKSITYNNFTINRIEVNNVAESPNGNDLSVFNQVISLTAFC